MEEFAIMNKRITLFGALAFTGTAAIAATTFAFAKPSQSLKAARGAGTYSCADIVASETVSNPSKSANITDLSTFFTTSLTGTMTDWTNANYGDKGTDCIKIGGSKTGKYSGSFKLTLTGDYLVGKVIVYAAGWAGDPGTKILEVNDVSSEVDSTASGDDYEFKPYEFELTTHSNTLVFRNDPSASGKRRVAISKIVFRCYDK